MRGDTGGEGQYRAAVEQGANSGAGGDMVGHEHVPTTFGTEPWRPFVGP
jgi:hypothetical protein